MASAKKRPIPAPPMGERVAVLETLVPGLKEATEKGFIALTAEVSKLAGSVDKLVTAEASRVAVEADRQRQRNFRTGALATVAGLIGSGVTAIVEWVRHS